MHKQFVSKVYFHFQNLWKQVSRKGFSGLFNRQGPQGKIFNGDWNSLCLQYFIRAIFCELSVCLDAPCFANDPSSIFNCWSLRSSILDLRQPKLLAITSWNISGFKTYSGFWTLWLGEDCVWPTIHARAATTGCAKELVLTILASTDLV